MKDSINNNQWISYEDFIEYQKFMKQRISLIVQEYLKEIYKEKYKNIE